MVKKKLSVNAICFIIAGAIIVSLFGVKAISETFALKSKGNIVYDGDGSIEIYSSDFETLREKTNILCKVLGIDTQIDPVS